MQSGMSSRRDTHPCRLAMSSAFCADKPKKHRVSTYPQSVRGFSTICTPITTLIISFCDWRDCASIRLVSKLLLHASRNTCSSERLLQVLHGLVKDSIDRMLCLTPQQTHVLHLPVIWHSSNWYNCTVCGEDKKQRIKASSDKGVAVWSLYKAGSTSHLADTFRDQDRCFSCVLSAAALAYLSPLHSDSKLLVPPLNRALAVADFTLTTLRSVGIVRGQQLLASAPSDRFAVKAWRDTDRPLPSRRKEAARKDQLEAAVLSELRISWVRV